MSSTDFFHGVTVANVNTGSRTIALPSSSIIGLVDTVPLGFGALATPGTAKPGVPTLITTEREAIAAFGEGSAITRACQAIYLRAKAVIVPQDLEGERFISYPHAVASRQHIDSIFAAYGVERRMNLETQLSMPMCKFVELGAGVALVDPISALEYKGEKVIFRPFEPTIEMDVSMLVPQHKKPSKLHESFLQHIRAFVGSELHDPT